MIRRATEDDLDTIVDLGRRFHAYSPWRDVPFDPDSLRAFCARVVETGVVFLSEDGLIGGILNPLYFNPAYIVGAELFWYAKEGGRDLRIAFEDWARESGAYAVQFSALGDEKSDTVEALFKRSGYRKVETGYLKEFQ